MSLTAKQEAFCLAFIETDSALDAYRRAGYSDGMSSKTATEAASRLLKNSNVLARIAELRAPAAVAVGMTLQGHLDDLKDLRDKAITANQYSAAIAAEVARGKASGVHVEKTESAVTTRTLDPLKDEDFLG